MPTFLIGIGIATGYATVGNFGSEAYTDYTVVGNTVHLAQRIEDVTPGGRIRVSAQTHHAVSAQVEARPLEAMTFKGISNPQEIYEVVGLRTE